MNRIQHQYIERASGLPRDERLLGDGLVGLLYGPLRENAPRMFQALTSSRCSGLLGTVQFETRLGLARRSVRQLMAQWGVRATDLVDSPQSLDTPAKLFMRRIRYWRCRPLDPDPRAVLAPADSRLLLGSLDSDSVLFIKDKFFSFSELVGESKTRWLRAFHGGDFALFRLTPEKYHYTHAPVSGRVVDHYQLDGACHSCNPTAVVDLITPFSKNQRVVTIIDSDVAGGSGVGLVAMIEVVALMVGRVEQRYSERRYEAPGPLSAGMMLRRGQPKAVFLPGSSTVVLLFQPGRVAFDQDLMANQHRPGVQSRFSSGFGRPLVETEVLVRSGIARALPAAH